MRGPGDISYMRGRKNMRGPKKVRDQDALSTPLRNIPTLGNTDLPENAKNWSNRNLRHIYPSENKKTRQISQTYCDKYY